MSPLAYEHWVDFALRMARTCFHGHRRPTSKWITDVVTDFFECFDDDDIPNIVDWCNSDNSGAIVCDDVTVFLEDHYCGYPAGCRSEESEARYYEQWDKQWGGPIHCCIRAGLDFAASPAAGVLGFTAGDVRKMFPEGVPDWVFPPGERLQYAFTDEINGTFAELPDSAGVML